VDVGHGTGDTPDEEVGPEEAEVRERFSNRASCRLGGLAKRQPKLGLHAAEEAQSPL
jgi:hypothetical protein